MLVGVNPGAAARFGCCMLGTARTIEHLLEGASLTVAEASRARPGSSGRPSSNSSSRHRRPALDSGAMPNGNLGA